MKLAKQLVDNIICGNMRGVKRALAAGAAVDGAPGSNVLPLVVAARRGRLAMVNLLLEKGANLEIATPHDKCSEGDVLFNRGTRALHAAALSGEVDILRALLKAGAQPNVKDGYGFTPLMATCDMDLSEAQRVIMIEVLLEAGALPSLSNNQGCVVLHLAANRGFDDVIKVLAAAAPGTLNHGDQHGVTPLCAAAQEGHESTVRLLLSVGANDKEAWAEGKKTSLGMAAQWGREGVTAALLDAGLEAVGGVKAAREAMQHAIRDSHPRILDMLLGVEGEEKRAWWANSGVDEDRPILDYAAMGCCLAATSVLLAAGADEGVCLNNTRIPASEIAGGALDEDKRDKAKEAALCRMLGRGPAFRARSCCWPVKASAAAGVAPVLAPSGGVATSNFSLGVRIFRPNSRTFFTSRIAR